METWVVVRQSTNGYTRVLADDCRVGFSGSLEFYEGAFLVRSFPAGEWLSVRREST